MLHRLRPLTVVALFVGLTVIISVVIVIATLAARADRAETRADRAEDQSSAVKAELYMAEQTQDATQADLDELQAGLQDTSRSLDRIKATNDKYAQRDAACRTVVKVSDELLSAAVTYGKVDNHLIHGRDGHANDLLDRVTGHTDKIDALVKDAGYASISELYNACTPDVLDYHGPIG